MMKYTTLCIPITKDSLLLGRKKVRFGAGKLNGFGGKIKVGETPEDAAVRELEEECGLCTKKDRLEKVAVLLFYFNGVPTVLMHTYLTREWSGKEKETDEMIPEWHPLSNVPYEEMWKADSIWLKKVLNGEKVSAHIYFKTDGVPGKDQEVFDRIEYDEKLWEK